MTGMSVSRAKARNASSRGTAGRGVRTDVDSRARRHIFQGHHAVKTRSSCDSVQTGNMW
jgi:hypothetical protein